MTAISTFANSVFGEIRVVKDQEGEPLFCLADVCDSLGLLPKRVNERLEDGVVSKYPILDRMGRTQQALFVNEDGLYDTILDSRKPEAKSFRKWITSEVLPAIRKTGGYMMIKDDETEEEVMQRAFLIATKNLEKRDLKIKVLEAEITLKDSLLDEQVKMLEEVKPKALFADAVSTSNDTILVRDLAKILKQSGVDTGEQRLFEWLRNNGYLISKVGADYNSPTQKSMNMGLMRLKETAVTHSNGTVTLSKTPKITGRGQSYFVNKFLSALQPA